MAMLRDPIYTTCISIIFFVYNLPNQIDSRPTGAPIEVCEHMTPLGHIRPNMHNDGKKPQTSEVPYAISLKVKKKNRVMLTLKSQGDKKFKGFMIKAINDAGEYFGHFEINQGGPKIQLMSCGDINGTAITHTSNEEKDQIHALWIRPNVKYNGAVTFQYTVVETFTHFWVNSSKTMEFGEQREVINKVMYHCVPLAKYNRQKLKIVIRCEK